MAAPDAGDIDAMQHHNISHVPSEGIETSQNATNEDAGDYCRICRGEASLEQPLFYPCKCSGSIKYVHQDCLMEWLSHSQKKHCELCKTPFHFTKLYDKSMPSSLPFPLFLRQILLHGLRTFSKWARYVIVACIWTCCLPWCIRQVWRGLFWLADGSWVSEKELRQIAMAELNKTTVNPAMDAIAKSLNLTAHANQSASHAGHSHVFNPLALLADPLSLVKTLQSFMAETPSVTESSNGTIVPQILSRSPSLLSDVDFVASLTPYPAVNYLLVDVLEGQFICLLVIAAFILVFLIREWVINQQPILNMPDPDQPDVPAQNVAGPANNEARLARRPRRDIRHRVERNRQNLQNLPVQNEIADAAQLPPPFPPARRAHTDDNIAFPTRPEFEISERPRVPARAASLSSASMNEDTILEGYMGTAVDSLDGADNMAQDEEYESPPLTRDALAAATDIRRNLEEAALLARHREAEAAAATASSVLPADLDVWEQHEPEPEVESEAPDAYPRHNVDGRSVATSFPVTGNEVAHQLLIQESDATHNDSSNDSLLPVIPTPEFSDGSADDEVQDNLDVSVADDNPAPNIPADTGADAEPQSGWEAIAAWLWKTDETLPQNQLPQDQAHGFVHEHVQDPVAEAPFVPVGQHRHPEHIPVPAQPPPPPRLEPNIQFGFDLNDPNAIDEAEDLDGILELMGMEGPIAGMVQNIIFSVFLITLTLAASVWCPYLWGKTALLCLANPIGVFVKAPLFLLSKSADLLWDMFLFVLGMSLNLAMVVLKLIVIVGAQVWPQLKDVLRTTLLEEFILGLTQNSGNRLEKTLAGTFVVLRPDLPTFSMQSHHALRVFKGVLANGILTTSDVITCCQDAIFSADWALASITRRTLGMMGRLSKLHKHAVTALFSMQEALVSLSTNLKPLSFAKSADIDYSLVEWSTSDKVVAILLGYGFFVAAGFMYLKIAHLILGLKDEEQVEGILADSLRQAGGVMKVVVIIGIEMLVFPLYCGFLLDAALLPLFEGATLHGRLAFLMQAPVTAIFLHWFIGTCYMFHFALFVSMCRKILRKGVLYFIRDPDDPTFHPVRDVLERPVATQLGKIAFSALVYGGLVILCLGGVIWSLGGISHVLPIRWATDQPRLAFPVDVIFFNFMLPFILRKAEPSKKISMIYEWWFRGCASGLRLTHFLFGEEREEEKLASSDRLTRFFTSAPDKDVRERHPNQKDGTYVRAPATDAVRIPKSLNVFLEVNENNERVDGKSDEDKGVHGKTDDRFVKVYIPPNFRARIVTFVVLLWGFAAATGIVFTIGPLVVGRKIVQLLAGTSLPPNDLYSLTVGVHVCGALTYGFFYIVQRRKALTDKSSHFLSNARQALPQVIATTKYLLGLLYMLAAFGVILPFAISLTSELYLHVPLFTYLTRTTAAPTPEALSSSRQSIPAVFVLQTWTLGLVYLRLVLRLILTQPHPVTQAAIATRAIVRNGWMRPDIRLASRAFILPVLTIILGLLSLPVSIAKISITALRLRDPIQQAEVYRYSYPALLVVLMVVYSVWSLRQQIAVWRVAIRDEVYLIGERLHNFQEEKPPKTESTRKGKQRAVEPLVIDELE